MKYIGYFVLVHCILTLGAGTVFDAPPWIVCKVLSAGLKLGVIAIWALAVYRLLQYMQRN